MQNILTGIYSRYSTSTDLKAALAGGLHREIAPAKTAMTYANYNVVSGRPDYMLGDTRYEIVTIQFDIYADTSPLRATAYAALITLYDDSKPTATGYTSILMERVSEQFVRDGHQNEVRRAVVTYECRYLKS